MIRREKKKKKKTTPQRSSLAGRGDFLDEVITL